MKRRLLQLAVFLLLGAIVNVAVAWGCETSTGRFGRSERLVEERDNDGRVVYAYLRSNDAGWPLRALSCGRHEEGLPLELDFAYRLGLKGKDPSLPIRPIWPGFAINTLFYGGILWLLFAAPVALRRWRRVRRGLCPACAYPVGESAVCTECGAAVTPKLKAES
jgi:hypothetical protein